MNDGMVLSTLMAVAVSAAGQVISKYAGYFTFDRLNEFSDVSIDYVAIGF